MTDFTYFSYTLTPRSRVSVGHGGEVRFLKRMEEIIRGTVVRGALGAAWWNSNDPGFSMFDDMDRARVFNEIFDEYMHVRQAVPEMNGTPAELHPVSAILCKYRSKKQCEKFMVDLAIEPVAKHTCPHCDQKTKNGKGWEIPGEWRSTVTTTAIDKRGVALDQNLFSRQVYNKNVVFRGSLRLDNNSPDFDVVSRWLQLPRNISVGGKKSVLGRVTWSAEVANTSVVDCAAFDSDLVAVQLQSPAILVDELSFPVLDLKKWLEATFHLPTGAEVVDQWTRPSAESGWNSIAGMPKPTDWALSAGSTALLRGWGQDALAQLSRGIGLRQNEGFGEVKLITSKAAK